MKDEAHTSFAIGFQFAEAHPAQLEAAQPPQAFPPTFRTAPSAERLKTINGV
jgi:hypothetical protein